MVLAALAVLLSLAFVVAPHVLAGATAAERDDLAGATRVAFTRYWQRGRADLEPGLQDLVDYWTRYHLAKAAIAAVLLAVLVALAALLWPAFVRIGPGRGGAGLALAGSAAGVTLLALMDVAVVLANVQGMLAPLSSLMSLLPVGQRDGDFGVAAGQIRAELGSGDGAARPPALSVLIDEFGRYHAVLAVAAALLVIAFLGVGAVLTRARARTAASARRSRRLLLSLAVLSGLSALFMAVECVANVSVAADPAPALLLFFQGSF
jgi:hypothetical protein